MASRLALAAMIASLASGCLALSRTRNGPVRDRDRAATRVVDVTSNAWSTTVTSERVADVRDADRPIGWGVGGKLGVAYGGAGPTAHGGYAQDFHLWVAVALGKFYVAPQLGFFMNIHAGDPMQQGQPGNGSLALGIPLEIDAGVRLADRLTVYGGGGHTLWGSASLGDVGEGAGFWRGRGGLLAVVRDGDLYHKEITLRLEGFAMTGGGDTIDYDAVGALLQIDLTFTTAGF